MTQRICGHVSPVRDCSDCRVRIFGHSGAAEHRFMLKAFGADDVMILERNTAEELAILLQTFLDAGPEPFELVSKNFAIRLVRRRSRNL